MSNRPVEMDDFEYHKENIVPVKSGRKADVLSELYKDQSKSDLAREKELEQKEKEFQRRIRLAADSDDPLEPHYEYFKWFQEHHTSGSSRLMNVVESAVRAFRKDERYKNDPRYLKLWLVVIKSTKEPVDVFKYLAVNGIAIKLATYYEEYATHMESIKK